MSSEKPVPTIDRLTTASHSHRGPGTDLPPTKPREDSADLPASVPLAFPPGYRLLRRLGSGGMGEVFEVEHEVMGRKAFKRIRSERLLERELVRFQREARALADLNHPHIVRIFDFGSSEGGPYFTMQLCVGGSLESRLEEFCGDLPRCVDLLIKIADALDYAHQCGLIHRDLKPGNVLLDEKGECYLSDFGLVRLADHSPDTVNGQADTTREENVPVADSPFATMTREGEILGTIYYMSPEQLRGDHDEVGPRSDIWALGILGIQLLTGTRPFFARDTELIKRLIRVEAPVPPTETNPGIDPTVSAILMKCLEKSPEARWQSAGQLADALRRWRSASVEKSQPSRFSRLILALPLFSCLVGFILAVSPVPPTRQQVLNSIHERLRRGETVSLLDSEGDPLLTPRIFSESTPATIERAGRGELRVVSVGDARIEFLPDPGVDHYVLRAVIRSESANLPHRGGIYVCSGEGGNTASERWLSWAELVYGEPPRRLAVPDIMPDLGKEQTRKPVVEKGQRIDDRVAATLRSHRIADGSPAPPFQRYDVASATLDPPEGPIAARELAIEVTPNRLRFTFEGGPFGTIALPPAPRILSMLFLSRPDRLPAWPFPAHGGVGISVYRGAFVIEKLELISLPD